MQYKISIILETEDEAVVDDLIHVLETTAPYMADNVVVMSEML